MKKHSHLSIFLFFIFLLSGCNSSNTATYYIDSVAGNDANSGNSSDLPWKTLAKLQAVSLNPGDCILLKRGGVYPGELEIKGTGMPDQRIYVEAYGDGEKPHIIGKDSSMYAVRVHNSDYLTLRNIAITNQGKERLARRTGLKIECKDYGVSHHIVIDSVDINDVNGSLVKEKGGGSGILIENGGKDVISVFDSLTIQNCRISRCSRNGIIWSGYFDRQNWHPSKHTLIKGNLIEEVPGDGIVPIGCDSTLICYNVMRNCPAILPETEAAAGIWPWSCDNTIIEFNEVSDHKAPWDAQGFDSDWNCTNTVIRYNYSHDNEGGMVLICNSGDASSDYNIGNIGTIISYNISINDAIRTRKTRVGTFSPTIHIAGPVKHTSISRNLIYIPGKPEGEVDNSLLTCDSWGGFADSTFISENIFYTKIPVRLNFTASTRNFFDNNIYSGIFIHPLKEHNSIEDVSNIEKLLTIDFSPEVLARSLMDTIQLAGFQGVFVNKEAIEKCYQQLFSTTK